MGSLSEKFARPDASIRRELLRAYADEWFAHYNYYFAALMVRGPSAGSIAALLRGKSDEAYRRADRLAQRIMQLGGQPVPKLTDLVEYATDKPFKLPEDLTDVEGLLRAVLDAERTSMRTHREIQERSRDTDPLTAALALELLGEAARGEQQLQTLLGYGAEELDGT